LLLQHFIQAVDDALDEIIEATKGLAAVVGLPRSNPIALEKILFDSAAVIEDQRLLGYYDKVLLPTYDVFDERRYFEPGEEAKIWNIAGKKVGVTICEDLWQHTSSIISTNYRRDPVAELEKLKPDLLLNLSASPYSIKKFEKRLYVCQEAAKTL